MIKLHTESHTENKNPCNPNGFRAKRVGFESLRACQIGKSLCIKGFPIFSYSPNGFSRFDGAHFVHAVNIVRVQKTSKLHTNCTRIAHEKNDPEGEYPSGLILFPTILSLVHFDVVGFFNLLLV